MDVWRIQHPTERDYSCYSVAHNSYSRIDYFFDLPLQALLGNILWSDHAPVHLRLTQLPRAHRKSSLCLNDNLLKDTPCVAAIKQAIHDFVLDHRSDDTSPLVK